MRTAGRDWASQLTLAKRSAMRRAAAAVEGAARRSSRAHGSVAFEGRLAAARLVRRLDRIGGGRIDPSRAGQLLLATEPESVSRLAPRLAHGTVVVSATNGKTTTTAMLASILRADGLDAVSSRSGLNMMAGIADELAAATRLGRRMRGDIGVFEVDELWISRAADALRPKVVLIGNLSRDQLDRYGELDAVSERVQEAVAALEPSCRVVACGDDPRVVDAMTPRSTAVFFGIDGPSLAVHPPPTGESTPCRRCGGGYLYRDRHLGHLGTFRCDRCGHARPTLGVTATDVTLNGDSTSFDLRFGSARQPIRMHVPGVHNLYNAVSAAAAAFALDVPVQAVAAGLARFRPVFGRGELVRSRNRDIRLWVVKNSEGMNAVIEAVSRFHNRPAGPALLLGFSGGAVYGRDASWIWDANFEQLARVVGTVTCTGGRADDVALRMKYAGVAGSRLDVERDVASAIDLAFGSGDGDLLVLCNYPGLLEVRGALTDRGDLEPYWR